MKKISSIFYWLSLVLALTLGVSTPLLSQSVSASANQTFFDCGGGAVQLSAIGTTSSTVFQDDFNTGQLQPGWSSNPAADFTNPCGASSDGTTYLWMGSGTSAPRTLTTGNANVACGGTVCFDFKFMCEYCGDSSPCEGADFYNEGVSLQYSTNGGGTWTDISYFAPNGNLLTNYPGAGASSPLAFGVTNFTTWNNYCFPIPAGAQSANTSFRLFQWGSSGSNFDHWGIDNVVITSTPCSPFYYDWLHIPGSPDAANVTTNVTQNTTFTVNYTDGTTTYTDQVVITVDNLEFDNFTVAPASCYGLSDASINATLLNGLAPFTFNLSGPVTSSNNTGSFTGLTAGLYVIEIIDANNCSLIENFVMPDGPSCCSVTAIGTDPTCNGLSNGSILSTPSGGIPAYSYQWYDLTNTPLPGQVYQSIGNIGTGTYVIQIEDVSGCINRDTVVLAAPAALTGSLTTNQINCFGVCDASIDMTNASGGTAPYQYALNNNNYSPVSLFNNLCQGNYTYKVKDANDCELTNTSAINQPQNLTVAVVYNNNEICGQGDGEFQVQASGGTGIYTYSIGATTNNTGIFTNLAGAVYPVVVTDQNGCSKTINVTVVNIPPPNPVIDYQQDVACAGGLNGAVTIVVSISTGTAPFTYDLNSTGPIATNTFNVNAGNHTVLVADANSCSGSVSFMIGQPTSLTFTTTKTDVTCNGTCDGTITISASGGTAPYQYSKDNGFSYQNSPVLTGLCFGNTFVVVKDANGCLANATIFIDQPTALNSSNTTVDPTCYNGCDGSISFGLTTGGNPPYEYSINGGATYQASPFFINLCADSYDLIVKDFTNCEFSMPNVILNNPLQITFNDISETGSNCGFANGGFEVQAINGTAAYSYSLDPLFTVNQPTGDFTALSSGLYTVYVEDANGCIDSTSEDVSDLEILTALDSTHNVTCFGGDDGGVFVNVIVGLAPYEFTLDSLYFQTTGTFDGALDPNVQLSAGTHFVIIHDSGNCADFYEFVITEPDSVTYAIAQVNTSCLTTNDGQITFNNVMGGDGGPYMYSIDNGANYYPTNNFPNLAAGVYNTIVSDGNGCLGAMTVNITQPTNISISINPSHLVCHGDNTGSMILVASGGAGGFNYDIGTANNGSGVFVGIAAGLYNIQATDMNGCVKDTMYTITEPDTLSLNLIVTDNLCFDDCSGEIDVTVAGGTPPYLYSANGGTSQQASNILQNLCNGVHTINVEDFKNCVFDVNQTIASPPNLTLALATVSSTCGNSNGTITSTVNGGTGVYTYYISDDNGLTFSAGSLINVFSNLAPNSYLIKVTDGNLCEIEMTTIITADPEPTIDFIQTTDILCNGETSGVIDITSGLGVGAHEYSLDNINYFPTNVFNNLAANTYDVYVRDANGCIVQSSATISEPALLQSNAVGTDLICNNDFSGRISMVPTGGTLNYLYSIDGGLTYQPFGVYDNLAANTYTTIVLDANNCSETIPIIIAEPTAIVTNIVTTNVSCFDACDGAIDLDPSGGTGLLTFQWTGNIAAPNVSNAINVCADSYNAIITDANGCIHQEFNIVINEPPQLVINSVIATNTSCYNICDGQIVIDAPLGVNFEIILNGISTTNATGTFTNLCDNNFDIVVTDIQGCQAFSNTSITEPDTLIGNAPSDWTNVCFGSNINISPGYTSGGTMPYSYNWTDANANSYPNTTTFTQNATAPNTYTYDIVDANGCAAGPFSFNMTVTDPLAFQSISPLDSTAYICPGESTNLMVLAMDGQLIDFGDELNYSYSWNTNDPNDTLTAVSVSPAITTMYTATVTDYCNAVITQTFNVIVYPDPTPDISPLSQTVCFNEQDQLSLSNINNIQGITTWKFSDGSSYTGQTINYNDNRLYFNEANTYHLDVSFVSDSGKCEGEISHQGAIIINPLPSSSFFFEPKEPRVSDCELDFTSLSVGDGPLQYIWNFGTDGRNGTSSDSAYTFNFINTNPEDPSINITKESPTTTIEVCLEVINTYACVSEACQFISIHEDLAFYIPNSFTPSQGEYNNTFKPVFASGIDKYQYQLLIFNRWGEVIFESNDPEFGWDGKYGDRIADQAAYVWRITYEDTYEAVQKTVSGHVTLIR
ncbi:MAG: T9SS type B sorting domain-containing protein [Crocinitomicaceae bacterium]